MDKKFIKPSEDKLCDNVYHIFPIRFEKRKRLMNYLSRKKISTLIYYDTTLFTEILPINVKEKYPISDEIHKTILSLPISVIHSERYRNRKSIE